MSDERVCLHGGLRRQCEACDLAERLETAVRLLRTIIAAVDEDDVCWSSACECECSGAVREARGFLATEPASPSRASGRPSGRA